MVGQLIEAEKGNINTKQKIVFVADYEGIQ